MRVDRKNRHLTKFLLLLCIYSVFLCLQKADSRSTQATHIRLLAGILSFSKNADNRQAIRETWGTHPAITKRVFILARPNNVPDMHLLRQEAEARKDIIILYEIMESYRNVTYQTLELYKIAFLIGSFSHVLKTDDDSYVRMDQLAQRLQSLPAQWTYLGRHMIAGDKFDRNPQSHKYVSQEWDDSHNQLPRYAFGSGYVLTADLASAIAFVPHVVMSHKLLNLEDVSTGIWIDYLHQERKHVHINYVTENRINGFRCSNNDLISHGLKNAQALRCLHKTGICCDS